MKTPGNIPANFPARMVRLVAVVVLAVNGLRLLNYLVAIIARYFSPANFGFSWGWVEWVLLGLTALSMVCAVDLLRWKSWARKGLIYCSLFWILGLLISQALWLWSEFRPPPNPRSLNPVWYWICFDIFSWLTQSILPALVTFVLLQPEVKAIWDGTQTSGFEVLPVAKLAEPAVSTQPH